MSYIKSFGFFIILLAQSLISFSQKNEKFEVSLEWGTEFSSYTINESSSHSIPNLKFSFFNGEEFTFIKQVERNGTMLWELSLETFDHQSVSSEELQFISKHNLSVVEGFSFKYKNNNIREKSIASVEFSPYLLVNGTVRRITSVVFNIVKRSPVSKKSTNFAENSVLADGSGEWFKIKVTSDGVHKLDYDFLKSIGVDVDNLSPNDLNIFGNGFGKLPELNSTWRPDDLVKNSIMMVDGGDNSFDPGDYILFYAQGPHKWFQGGSYGYSRELNVYANYSAYFINVNSSETPLRISNASLIVDPASHVVTDFDAFAIHERELVNLLKGGQRWYGEEFDAQLSQNFSFNFPNLNTAEPVIVRSFLGYKFGGGSANFSITYNGSTIGSSALGNISDANSVGRAGFTTAPGQFNPTSSVFTLTANFNRSIPSDAGYLDFIEVNAKRNLIFGSGQLLFRNRSSVGVGNITEYQVSNFPPAGVVWDVTTWTNPRIVQGGFSGGVFSFKSETDSLKTFVAFDGSSYFTPEFEKRVEYQNLHGLPSADYLIVTHPTFLSQANRLAALHQQNGLSVHVVTLEKLYNEFSGGTQDPTAIRTFARMFYERSAGDTLLMPKYLLLFGDGTYDPLNRVSNNNYMVPVYHTVTSEGYVSTLLSDDYFGFLDPSESFGPSDNLDIAVGRLVATTPEQARDLVNKIEHYMRNGSNLYASSGVQCGEDGFASTQGDWRLRYTTIADDEENGYFLTVDLEPAYNYVKANHPEMNVNKIYADAFSQISTAGGERYPEVNTEIDRSIESGSLLTCYVGHGGAMGAASERIITIGQITNYRNINRLTLFVSATCEFGRIDDNERVSAGEWFALNPIGGAIALMTTTRAVYFSTNSVTTGSFFEQVFLRDMDQKPRTFGDIITDTKNNINTGVSNNKRSFMLLGDPALRIALPYETVKLDSVNGIAINLAQDTLRALSKARFSGHLEDQFGNSLNSFNGVMQPSIFDKTKMQNTLSNDANSPVIPFEQQKNVLYRGKVSVTNGLFNFDFIVPKDIDYAFGNGKSSFYAFTPGNDNAGGYSKDFIVGGIDTSGLNDNIGPEITLYLNDESFVNGGITDEAPILIAELFDESGINTVGNGIGHDITVILDDETSAAKVLNEFYEADLDTYKSGSLRYPFNSLEPGIHTLTFKAWDVNNNSSDAKIEFIVQEREEVALDHVLNYPNPFTTSTKFMFEHNQVCAALETQIEVFTVTGRLVKTINTEVKTQGFRTEGIHWDGKDDFGDQLAKGVYVYRVTVTNPDGGTAQAMEKLYLLK
jgi:hypothetical protein